MAKFQSPLLGYNNNVRHKNRVFHIQTEDSGVNHPHIITHLFMDGGRILKSVKKSYAEHVGADGMQEIVRVLMKEQHKAIFIALRDGQFDSLVDGGAAPAPKGGKTASVASVAPPAIIAELAVATTTAASPLSGARAVEEGVAISADAELPPNTIDETNRPRPGSIPAPASAAQTKGDPRAATVPPPPTVPEDVPMTTRQPQEARPDATSTATVATASRSGRELTLDFDALEQAGQEAVAPSSLFHASDLPPPPKNLFTKEPGTGGAYRAVEANAAHEARQDARHDAREEPAARSLPREERDDASATKPQSRFPPARVPPNRAAGEARYAPARPAAIFGTAQRPAPQSIFSDELVSDKSLDEVILSYLAEDLEPPRRK